MSFPKKIIRVFPSKTHATPDDEDVRIATPPSMFEQADEIHIPVIFTWDIPMAEKLAKMWEPVAPVKVGGPALGAIGGDFTPGLYTRKGYVMTSRGCPNRCWFCSVWRREGGIRELPLTEGYNLLDSNILACSDEHIKAVFSMLVAGKKKYHKPIEFTGGLEAKILKKWHCEELDKLKAKQLFFAYDTHDDLEPLVEAGKLLRSVGNLATGHRLRCYVLCGFNGDTFDKAEARMDETMRAGFMPMAMLYRDKKGDRDKAWSKWQRLWCLPMVMASKMKAISPFA